MKTKSYGLLPCAVIGIIGAVLLLLSSVMRWPNRVGIVVAVVYLAAAIVMTLLLNGSFNKSLNKIYKTIKDAESGRLDARSNVKGKNQAGLISSALDEFLDYYQNDVIGTIKNIADGNLTKSDIMVMDGDDETGAALKKLSDMADSLEKVLHNAAEGEFNSFCDTVGYSGIWKIIAEDTNSMMQQLSAFSNEVKNMVTLLMRADYSQTIKGQYKGVLKEIADSINSADKLLERLQNLIIKASEGDTGFLEQYEDKMLQGGCPLILQAVVEMMRNINNLIKEIAYLSEEAANGNIKNARGDESKFNGGYKEIIMGFNSVLDAVAQPLAEAEIVLNRISICDFTLKCEGNYKGEFNNLTSSINNIQEEFIEIQNIAEQIAKGDVSSLEMLKSTGRKSENDRLIPALTGMMESIKQLLDETTRIAGSVSNGDLDVRGDTSKFNGEYAAVIESINNMLTAVAAPINEITNLLVKLTDSGDLSTRANGEYKGKFKLLSDSLNQTLIKSKSLINYCSDALTEMAKGNFSIPNVPDFAGDYKALSAGVNGILESLNGLLLSIKKTARNVEEGCTDVSSGSKRLSQGTAEQASSIEELSSTIAEIAESTKENALDAEKASSFVGAVKHNATSGSKQMDEMLSAMDEISESSKNISKIIKVIDDIAFQTNILSLNAAVEAARAGEAGKGFAVVAEEVRNLATRSANAAKDTTALIESTVDKVEKGTVIAKNTAKAFDGIVNGVDKVTEFVSKISTASNEQATGISQINKGLEQVSSVLQTSSATSEAGTSASEKLKSQANALNSQVAKFVLRGGDTDAVKTNLEPDKKVKPKTINIETGEFGKY